MDNFRELREQVAVLGGLLDEGAGELADAMRTLGDEQLVRALEAAARAVRSLGRIEAVGAGILAERSTRESGHDGLAQTRGHRTSAEFVQAITGASRADARQRIRVGQSVLDAADESVAPRGPGEARAAAWHAPLAEALMRGRLSPAQSDAIRRGLGEPPTAEGGAANEGSRGDWSAAAEQLADEAAHRTVEELRSEARLIRDRLDPDGAERRFLARHEARAFRSWTDDEGRSRASICFDDDGHALVRSIFDAALRPRRGGPRFVDDTEREAATALADDPRTNDQLSYDLLVDLLRAGAFADAKVVHGTRRAGVRVVSVIDTGARGARSPGGADADSTGGAGGAVSGVGAGPGGYTEDGLVSLPRRDIDRRICDTAALPVEVSTRGDPLNVGRERRLFTPAQRVALAVRDGGCRWSGCDRPASYCEAHHIDAYSQDGRTDIDRGILLCRFHHMQLHHSAWQITRDGRSDFVLHDPGGRSITLAPRLALTYAFAGVDPPPRRFRPAA
ncbi:HNH endonuclease signature motif containing protein [Microbacterium sp. G2-8]|uniref:HNH endonuclease signature motif containing protein n=1 Tax=Microbacterium sp. G2-8 TaxID=2842454 RepID=UPI001C89A5C1|nr:HNH endonuclease signature motif containing protein [Microbacterium sp. G2-8]